MILNNSKIEDELLRKEFIDEVSEESAAHHSSSCGRNGEVLGKYKHGNNDKDQINSDLQPCWPSTTFLLRLLVVLRPIWLIDDLRDVVIIGSIPAYRRARIVHQFTVLLI